MFRLFASLLTALAIVGNASACLNDSELPNHEREFRSSYKRQVVPEPKESQWSLPESTPVVLLGGSGLLLLGAGLVTLRRPFAKG